MNTRNKLQDYTLTLNFPLHMRQRRSYLDVGRKLISHIRHRKLSFHRDVEDISKVTVDTRREGNGKRKPEGNRTEGNQKTENGKEGKKPNNVKEEEAVSEDGLR